MNNVNEIFPYVQLVMALVASILALVLASSAKNLIGKQWLVASTSITLLTWPTFLILSLIARHSDNVHQIYRWYGVINLFTLFGTACFGLFLFSNWSRSRMKLDLRDLLFSFSGRIPRSAFWISLCILSPLSTILGFAPFTSDAEGFPKIVIWIVYAGWLILSIWISLAIYTKRWHDCSKSGWMSLVMLIPIVGVFWFFRYLGFVQGIRGVNQYGDDPLGTHTA